MDKMFDDAKTMAEHQRIIMTYRSTGKLDREDAILTVLTLSILQA